MLTKRLFIFIILALIVLLLLAGGFYFFGKNKQPEVIVEKKPEAKLVVTDPVISPIPSFDRSSMWYFNFDSRLFRINLLDRTITEYPFAATELNLREVIWPATGSDFIAVGSESYNDVKYYFDSATNKFVKLASNIQHFDWLPDGKRIVYIWQSADGVSQQLNTSNADGTGYKVITEVFWPDFKVIASPNGKEVLLVRERIEGDINKIYRADLETGKIEIVLEEGKSLDAKWLPTLPKFLFTQLNSKNTESLYLYDFYNRQKVNLNLETSLNRVYIDPEEKFIYAAITESGTDKIWKLDLVNYKQELYFQLSENMNAKNLNWASGKLFFVNISDNKLYSIEK